MTMRMRALALFAAPLALLAGLSTDADAAPARRAPPACGAKILPLVTGNSWTYEPVAARDPIQPDLVKLQPRTAKSIVITVKSIDTKGGDTVANLEEKITYVIINENKEDKKPEVTAEVVVNSTITCNKTKFEISPDSFFFAGEPGGYHELELDKLERSKATSLKLTKGTIGADKWEEDIVAHFVRKPSDKSGAKLSGGKLELERVFTPAQPEDVFTKTGEHYAKSEKLQLITTGRITLDDPLSPTPKVNELPKNWRSLIWLHLDTGVVQTLNMFAHQYQLTSATLK